MLQKVIHKIVRKHHPWRKMKFDELAELYTSMTIRSLGFSLIGIFVPVYLYKTGVSLQGVFAFYSLFFLLRIPTCFLIGKVVGRIGPKHTIALSTILFVAFLGLLVSYESFGWPLWILAGMFTFSNGLFFIAYNTDFSKVNHKKHGGKELGWLMIFERFGGALGPVVGGLLAGIFAPQASMVFAITVLLASLVPLFMTNEPVKTHQKISYRDFQPRKYISDFIAFSAFSVVNVANGVLWPLLVAVVIFTENTYEKLGILIGVTLAISMLSARFFGKFIDNKKGGYLLAWGAQMHFVVSICRALITGSGGAIAGSVIGEPIALATRMPITKGYYDGADSVDSSDTGRIEYLVWGEAWGAAAKAIQCFSMAVLCYHYDSISVLRGSFVAIAFIGFVMLIQRFPALKKV